MPKNNVRRFRVLLGLVVLVITAGCGLDNLAADPSPESTSGAGEDVVESVLDFVSLAAEPMPCGEDAFVEGAECLVPVGEVLGDDIVESAEIFLPQELDWAVSLVMTVDGITAFNEVASSCFLQDDTCPTGRIGVVSDGELISAPMIQAATFERDQIVISGNFTQEEAEALVDALNS